MEPSVTSQIEETAFRLLEENPEGLRWAELDRLIKEQNPSFHPKTINGTLWKLNQKYPDRVLRVEGVFKLKK